MSTETTQPSGVRYFPLDVSKLAKGQTLSIAELEEIIGIKSTSPRWCLKLLTLRQQIERLRSKLGLPTLTMRTHQGTLIVCDDVGASNYNHSMGKRGIRRFARASARNIAVDVTKLTEEQAKVHARRIMRQAMMLVAIRSSSHKALPEGNGAKRATPKMVTGLK